MDGVGDGGAVRELLGSGAWARSATPAHAPHAAASPMAGVDRTVRTIGSSEAAENQPSERQEWARDVAEFVPTRIDVDLDGLRAELIGIAVLWLGVDDAAPIAGAIATVRPGVDDFMQTISAIQRMRLPGRDAPLMFAMAREMRYRATETLCGA